MFARHDPYSEYDRFPSGACPAGSCVNLRLRCEETPARAFVRLWRDRGEEWLPMRSADGKTYEADVRVGTDTGVVWYYFVLEDDSGRRYYLGKPEGEICGMYDNEPPSFQITVYDPKFETPVWMRESVMMQIMVDRFAIGGLVTLPHARGAYLHSDWYEPPHLCPKEALDFFGGNLRGIREKLPFLKELGIGALYLNPIFKARSNHKYDTGDYMCIDPSFGDEAELKRLLSEAGDAGIRVVLDGVFSHTGADSRYFNRYGTYDSAGAYNRYGESPYSPWYRFLTGKDDYDCWWGIETLPNVNETEPSYLDFIINGEDSVVPHYINTGTSGWRLDVADELPMEFIRALRSRAKRVSPEACVIGEVWEDISCKVAYGQPRCYASGDTLDSAMNYPLRDGIISFLLGKTDAYRLSELINHQESTLPKPMLYSMMNLLGSHDKPRIIDVLSGRENLEPKREEREFMPLTPKEYERGKANFIKAFEFICALPGMPCLYYGDDAGLTGMGDPFCRRTYPWGREDTELQSEIKRIIKNRNVDDCLKTGGAYVRALSADKIEIIRENDKKTAACLLERR